MVGSDYITSRGERARELRLSAARLHSATTEHLPKVQRTSFSGRLSSKTRMAISSASATNGTRLPLSSPTHADSEREAFLRIERGRTC